MQTGLRGIFHLILVGPCSTKATNWKASTNNLENQIPMVYLWPSPIFRNFKERELKFSYCSCIVRWNNIVRWTGITTRICGTMAVHIDSVIGWAPLCSVLGQMVQDPPQKLISRSNFLTAMLISTDTIQRSTSKAGLFQFHPCNRGPDDSARNISNLPYPKHMQIRKMGWKKRGGMQRQRSDPRKGDA
jgi:hypothetical protein